MATGAVQRRRRGHRRWRPPRLAVRSVLRHGGKPEPPGAKSARPLVIGRKAPQPERSRGKGRAVGWLPEAERAAGRGHGMGGPCGAQGGCGQRSAGQLIIRPIPFTPGAGGAKKRAPLNHRRHSDSSEVPWGPSVTLGRPTSCPCALARGPGLRAARPIPEVLSVLRPSSPRPQPAPRVAAALPPGFGAGRRHAAPRINFRARLRRSGARA
jgi:hypothetical protein